MASVRRGGRPSFMLRGRPVASIEEEEPHVYVMAVMAQRGTAKFVRDPGVEIPAAGEHMELR